MTEIKIEIPEDKGLCEVIVDLLHKGGFHEFANQIAVQVLRPPLPEPTGDVVVFFSNRHPYQGSAFTPDDGQWGDGGPEMPWVELVGKGKPDDVMLYRRVPYPEDGQPSAFDLANMADESARLDAANADEDARADTSAAYEQGGADVLVRLGREIKALRAAAITAERQDAYDTVLILLEAIS